MEDRSRKARRDASSIYQHNGPQIVQTIPENDLDNDLTICKVVFTLFLFFGNDYDLEQIWNGNNFVYMYLQTLCISINPADVKQ
jgi:hypothetical protein